MPYMDGTGLFKIIRVVVISLIFVQASEGSNFFGAR